MTSTEDHAPAPGRKDSDITDDTPKKTPKTPTASGKPRSGKPELPPRVWIDWEAGHGTITGPMAMAADAMAAAALGTALDLPTIWPAAVAAAGALTHGLIAPLRRGSTWATVTARVTGWFVGGCWASAVLATDPRHWSHVGYAWAAATLAAGTLLAGALAVEADLREEAADEDMRAAANRERNTERWAIAKEWVARIERVARVTVTPVGLTIRPDGTGFRLEVTLPEGYPAAQLAGYNVALAEAARLPVGCLVQIEPTDIQGRILLDVDTVSTADRIHDYGDDFTALSVLTGIPWFVDRSGARVNVFMREACALILAPPGGGKSTLLDAILAGFCRCPDALTWVIDLGKNGNAARAFLTPWLESQGLLAPPPGQDRLPGGVKPGIDWVAPDAQTALDMLMAAETLATWRLGAYAELMRQRDTTLLPISARIPFLTILVDEGVELLGYGGRDPVKQALKAQLIRLMETTRAMGIRLVLTAVDGNLTALGDSRVRKFSNVRVALTATDAENAGTAKLFPGLRGIDPRQLRARGAGVAEATTDPGGFGRIPIRTVKTTPSFARTAVAATNRWRAQLEPAAAAILGEVYIRRWDRDRLGWLLGESAGAPAAPSAGGPAATPARPAATGGTLPPLNWRHSRTDTPAEPTAPAALGPHEESAIAEFHRVLGMLPEAPDNGPGDGGAPLAGTGGDRDGSDDDGTGASAAATPVAWRGRAIEILRQAGPDVWMSTRDIRNALAEAGLDLGRQIVSEALAAMARKNHIRTRGTGPATEYSANLTD